MDCCIDTYAEVGRFFHFTINFDICNLQLTFKIEDHIHVVELFDFEGNLEETVTLKDVVSLRFVNYTSALMMILVQIHYADSLTRDVSHSFR